MNHLTLDFSGFIREVGDFSKNHFLVFVRDDPVHVNGAKEFPEKIYELLLLVRGETFPVLGQCPFRKLGISKDIVEDRPDLFL